jgi:hypothetical protein
VQFDLDRFVKSRFQSRRECAEQTRKVATCLCQCNRTRGAVNKFGAELVLKGGDLFADGRLTNFHVLSRQRRSSLFRLFGRIPALHRICPHQPPYSSMEWILCEEYRFFRLMPCKEYRLKKVSSSALCIPIGNGLYSRNRQIHLQEWHIS